MASDTAFVFHMSMPCDKIFLLVPSSRSSVKVKNQGHSFGKMAVGVGGISVSQTQLVYRYILWSHYISR